MKNDQPRPAASLLACVGLLVIFLALACSDRSSELNYIRALEAHLKAYGQQWDTWSKNPPSIPKESSLQDRREIIAADVEMHQKALSIILSDFEKTRVPTRFFQLHNAHRSFMRNQIEGLGRWAKFIRLGRMERASKELRTIEERLASDYKSLAKEWRAAELDSTHLEREHSNMLKALGSDKEKSMSPGPRHRG
jgi:hypothetical protein